MNPILNFAYEQQILLLKQISIDYNIDYNSTNGPVNIFLHESLTMDSDDVVVVQFLSRANPA